MPYVEALRKYADFNGRATRTEYWQFLLIHIIICVALILIYVALTLLFAEVGEFGIMIPLIYILATYIPYLAVGARRLHDTGRSGWWQLISIVALIMFMLPSEGDNKYGSRPV